MQITAKAIIFVLLAQTIVFSETPTSKPNEIVVNMKYHGGKIARNDPKPQMTLFAYPVPKDYFSGFTPEEKKFFREVKKIHSDIKPYSVCLFTENGKFYLDYKDRKVVAAYYDANQDGKIDKKDKLVKIKGIYKGREYYITYNYDQPTPDGRIIPFRFMIEVKFDKEKKEPTVRWYECGYYKGNIKVDGKNYIFILMPDTSNKSYSYAEFGKSYYLVVPEGKRVRRERPQKLTTQIKIGQRIFDFDYGNFSEDGKSVNVTFTDNDEKLANFKINVLGRDKLKYDLENIELMSETGNTTRIRKTDSNKQIPEGKYKIASVYVSYGKEKVGEYSCFLGESNYFDVWQGKANSITVGQPKLKILCYTESENDRVKSINTGTSLNIKVFIGGIGNEGYGTFGKKEEKWKYYGPVLKIFNASGNEIFSGNLHYYVKKTDSKEEYVKTSWQTLNPGKYTLVVSMDTGPLGGVIEDKQEIIVTDPKQRLIIMCVSGGVLVIILIVLAFTWKKGFHRNHVE